MALLSIGDLDVFYGRAQALHGVSLEVEAGRIVAVVGPNGAGKSTLLDSIIGLTRRRGQIQFEGRDISRLAPARIVRLGIGYAPERGNLFPFMGVKENLLVGAYRKRDQIDANLAHRLRVVPAPGRAAEPGDRDPVGRRAPDGLPRPGADVEPQALDGGRADAWPCTQGVPRHRRRSQGLQRATRPHNNHHRAERELRHEPGAGGLSDRDRPHRRQAHARGAARIRRHRGAAAYFGD